MKFVFKKLFGAVTVSAGLLLANNAYAQTPPVACPNYKPSPTKVAGPRVGKKVASAFEAYSADLIDEAIEILKEINAKEGFDKAYVDQFVGKLLAGQDGKQKESLGYLVSSVKEKLLNDGEHAEVLRLVADLSMQERQYPQAIDYYNRWMDFTCKQDPRVYVLMGQAFLETKQLDKMIEPADKAIALYEEPSKDPYLLKITSYFERKMMKETIDVAETLVKLFPDNKQWWVQLGQFYMADENYDSALQTMEVAYINGFLEKDSHIKNLAQLYDASGIPFKAASLRVKYMDSGLLKKDDEVLLTRTASAFQRSKEFKKAAEYYGKAAAISKDPEHLQKQGSMLYFAEDYAKSIEVMEKALEAGSDKKGNIHISLMEANFYLDRFKEAYAHAKEAKKFKSVARNAAAWEPHIKSKAELRGVKI